MAKQWTNQELVQGCLDGDSAAQRALYERFGPRLLAVCRRYVGNTADAEDILADGMYKALTRLEQLATPDAVEFWLKRIMVNESLMFLRKNKVLLLHDSIEDHHHPAEQATIEVTLTAADILILLDQLPPGYRTVFNLFVMDGLKHQEIADQLGVSVSTSKTQLLLARQRMQQLILRHYGPDFINR
jgi:RNA polymerase sigma factor (sigma-70 family)